MNAATIVLIILGVMILGLAILFLESARELKQARVKEYTMQLPGHPRGRILFLSDYHEAVRGKNNEMILAKIREIKPDIILIGGDMVNGKSEKEDFTPAVTLINGMVEIAPVVYAMGNHEMRCVVNSREYGYHWDQYEQALSPKIRMLINDHMDWELPEGKIRIYGLNMEKTYYKKHGEKLTVKEMDRLVGRKEEGLPVILLAHDPTWAKVYEAWGSDLTLSGHFHGGIIRLPFIGGIISPKYEPFPHYDYGYYPEKDGKTLVTCGLGQHTIPVRFNNPPEMVLINLY